MRFVFSFALTIGLMTTNGCKLIDELRTFDLDYSTEFTIPSSTILNLPVNLPTPSVTTDSEQQFEDEGVKSEWIDSIKLTRLKLVITAPTGEDFSFLDEVRVYINTESQQETLLAQLVPVPENAGGTIELEVSGSDLYPYISQSSFSLRTQVVTDESMTQSIDVRADMKFEVKATIPGV